MTCGLPQEIFFLLNILYTNRCFKSSAGYHSEKLHKLFRAKKFSSNYKDIIKTLHYDGYISTIKKVEVKYYIIDKGKVARLLGQHGYEVTTGGRLHHI